jgi:hypothetical protein
MTRVRDNLTGMEHLLGEPILIEHEMLDRLTDVAED